MMTNTNKKTAKFHTSREAWAFMREVDERGWTAGYPQYHPDRTRNAYTVTYIERSPAEVAR